MREESADTEENTPESLLIKEERLEDNLWSRDPQPTPAEEQVAQPTPAEHPKKHVTQPTPAEEQVTQPTPAEDPEEEDLSGLEFVVKAEQEEEHVAQRLSQTGCEHSVGRLNNLDSEYVTYERDGQLWTSFTPGDSDIETDDPVCDNATEQYSQSLPVHTELQHIPPTLDSLSSLGSIDTKAHIAMFDTVQREEEVKVLSVCSGQLRSGVAPAHQCQYGERLSSMAHNNLTSQSQQQHHQSNPDPPDEGHSLSGNNCSMERKAKSHRRASTGEKRFSCSQCGKNFTTRFYLKIHRRIHTGERPFNCTQCGKRFYCTSHLTSHQRSHTGEKPYSCDECGNSYSHLNSLKLHYRIHSDERVNYS
ncbi:zinc finger protein 287 [Megalops cyprinoides]|uniref:zinc finger protein 287 n=1 Tax=Megalops cyprinoides TaxID=118141 RepID=UPI001864D81D|nr:zinc finger protein 287 [Megalops cyprinoides]